MKRVRVKPKENKQIKFGKPLKWHFTSDDQADLIANAMIAQSNRVIRRDCRKTDHEIQYALYRAKKVLGMTKAIRQQWRDGESDVVKMVKADVLAILREEVKRDLGAKLIHKPAEIVEDKTPPQPPPPPPQP